MTAHWYDSWHETYCLLLAMPRRGPRATLATGRDVTDLAARCYTLLGGI